MSIFMLICCFFGETSIIQTHTAFEMISNSDLLSIILFWISSSKYTNLRDFLPLKYIVAGYSF